METGYWAQPMCSFLHLEFVVSLDVSFACVVNLLDKNTTLHETIKWGRVLRGEMLKGRRGLNRLALPILRKTSHL